MEISFSSVPSAVLCFFFPAAFSYGPWGKKKIKLIKLGKVLIFSVRMASGFFASSPNNCQNKHHQKCLYLHPSVFGSA